MRFIYNLFISIFDFFLRVNSNFNKKSRNIYQGRKRTFKYIQQKDLLEGLLLKYLAKKKIFLIKFALFAKEPFIGERNGKEIGKMFFIAQKNALKKNKQY